MRSGVCRARRLSGFAYTKFSAVLKARGAGVALVPANPVFASMIGRLKYSPGRAMSA